MHRPTVDTRRQWLAKQHVLSLGCSQALTGGVFDPPGPLPTHPGAWWCLMCASPGMFVVSWARGWFGLWVMSCCPSAGPSHTAVRVPRRHPPVLRMVLEALQAGERQRGTSVMAIKVYILRKYPTVDAVRLKYLLKRALDTGMQRGLLIRPINSKAKGATGSFKVSLLVGGMRGAQGERDSARV